MTKVENERYRNIRLGIAIAFAAIFGLRYGFLFAANLDRNEAGLEFLSLSYLDALLLTVVALALIPRKKKIKDD